MKMFLLLVAQVSETAERSRSFVPVLIALVVALLGPTFKRWYMGSAGRRVQLVLNAVMLLVGIAMLVAYHDRFGDLMFPPPTRWHGLALAFILLMPAILVMLSSFELWRLLRNRQANQNART